MKKVMYVILGIIVVILLLAWIGSGYEEEDYAEDEEVQYVGNQEVAQTSNASNQGLVGQWQYAEGVSVPRNDFSDSNSVFYRMEGYGSAGVYTFTSNGQYKFYHASQVSTGTCNSQGFVTELGSYQFNGSQVTVVPQSAEAKISICGSKPESENQTSNTRTYRVDSIQGGIKLTGPCAPYQTECNMNSIRDWDYAKVR